MIKTLTQGLSIPTQNHPKYNSKTLGGKISTLAFGNIDGRLINNFYFASDWDSDEPWTWYLNSDNYHPKHPFSVADVPFLALAGNNKIAIGSPVHINYVAEFYDENGSLIGAETGNHDWLIAQRNSNLVNKYINSGAAFTNIDINN